MFFKEIIDLLTPEPGEEPIIGYFLDNQDKRVPAIVQMYAINQEVYGLEIVVSEIGTEIERFEGGVKIETQNVEIYLTQHESPRPKINDAISRFKNWENFQKYRGETIAAPATQANLRRYLISGQFQCTC